MKMRVYLSSLFLLLSTICIGQQTERDSIKQAIKDAETRGLINFTFTEYHRAINKNQIDKAIEFVSKETINYYDEIIEKARYSDSAQLKEELLTNQIYILQLRHTKSKEVLEKLTGIELLKEVLIKSSYEYEWQAPRLKLRSVELSGDRATASVEINGKEHANATFVKEDGVWKNELTSDYISYSNDMMLSTYKSSGLTENEFILKTVMSLSSVKITRLLWNN